MAKDQQKRRKREWLDIGARRKEGETGMKKKRNRERRGKKEGKKKSFQDATMTANHDKMHLNKEEEKRKLHSHSPRMEEWKID